MWREGQTAPTSGPQELEGAKLLKEEPRSNKPASAPELKTGSSIGPPAVPSALMPGADQKSRPTFVIHPLSGQPVPLQPYPMIPRMPPTKASQMMAQRQQVVAQYIQAQVAAASAAHSNPAHQNGSAQDAGTSKPAASAGGQHTITSIRSLLAAAQLRPPPQVKEAEEARPTGQQLQSVLPNPLGRPITSIWAGMSQAARPASQPSSSGTPAQPANAPASKARPVGPAHPLSVRTSSDQPAVRPPAARTPLIPHPSMPLIRQPPKAVPGTSGRPSTTGYTAAASSDSKHGIKPDPEAASHRDHHKPHTSAHRFKRQPGSTNRKLEMLARDGKGKSSQGGLLDMSAWAAFTPLPPERKTQRREAMFRFMSQQPKQLSAEQLKGIVEAEQARVVRAQGGHQMLEDGSIDILVDDGQAGTNGGAEQLSLPRLFQPGTLLAASQRAYATNVVRSRQAQQKQQRRWPVSGGRAGDSDEDGSRSSDVSDQGSSDGSRSEDGEDDDSGQRRARRSRRQQRTPPLPMYSPDAIMRHRGRRSGQPARRRAQPSPEPPGDPGAKSTYAPLLSRVKRQLTLMRHEEHLVSTYQADGWKGRSRERVQLTGELQKALASLQRRADAVRAAVRACDEAPGLTPIPKHCFDSKGEVGAEHVFCAVCGDFECDDDNDIILCDGECGRAFHCMCVNPHIGPKDLTSQCWLCPTCHYKDRILDEINADFGTEYELYTPWQEILATPINQEDDEDGVALLSAPWLAGNHGGGEDEDDQARPRPGRQTGARSRGGQGAGAGAGRTLLDVDLPSEDEDEDESYEADPSRSDGSDSRSGSGSDPGSGGSESDSGSGSGSGSGSDSGGGSDDGSDSDDGGHRQGRGKRASRVEPLATGRRKRRRTAVDYVKLHHVLFGTAPDAGRGRGSRAGGEHEGHAGNGHGVDSSDEEYHPGMDDSD